MSAAHSVKPAAPATAMPAPGGEPLPLRYATPADWAPAVLRRPLALLNDHAHLEKKAAANALELLHRWPAPSRPAKTATGEPTSDEAPPPAWAATMTAVAQDETEHLARVVRLLQRRGGHMTRSHRNAYAAELRKLVRLGRGPEELVDRLLVSALIELRSCERFAVLGAWCARAGGDAELAELYQGLYASEAGHYRVFVKLARDLFVAQPVERRWDQLLGAEARVIAHQPAGVGMHSGAGSVDS